MADPSPRCYMIGYAGGRSDCSISDGALLNANERLLHYRTPTEPGSGGSPVFDASWKVVALHHGRNRNLPKLTGEGVYEAAEGVSIHAIQVATGRVTSWKSQEPVQVYFSFAADTTCVPILADVLRREFKCEVTTWKDRSSNVDKLSAGISDADVFVSLVDERNFRSPLLLSELTMAMVSGKPVFYVLLSDSILANSLPFQMHGAASVRVPVGGEGLEDAARQLGNMIRDAVSYG